jgi:hypothetical protein
MATLKETKEREADLVNRFQHVEVRPLRLAQSGPASLLLSRALASAKRPALEPISSRRLLLRTLLVSMATLKETKEREADLVNRFQHVEVRPLRLAQLGSNSTSKARLEATFDADVDFVLEARQFAFRRCCTGHDMVDLVRSSSGRSSSAKTPWSVSTSSLDRVRMSGKLEKIRLEATFDADVDFVLEARQFAFRRCCTGHDITGIRWGASSESASTVTRRRRADLFQLPRHPHPIQTRERSPRRHRMSLRGAPSKSTCRVKGREHAE